MSVQGDDSHSGLSASSPWKTLAKLNAIIFQPGDVILLHAGDTWTGELHPKGSGVSGAPIRLSKYGGKADPILHGPGTNGSAALSLRDQEYWEISNIEVTNSQPEGGGAVLRGIYISGTSSATLWHHIHIGNCSVRDVNSVGYGVPSYSKMSGGILFEINIEDALVEGCRIHNVAIEGVRNSSPVTTSHVVIRHNIIDTVYGDGIVLHGSNGDSVIEYNSVHNACTSDAANYAGIWTYASRRTLIQHNEVSGITGGGPNDGEAFDADIDTDGDVFQYNYSHDNGRGFMLFMASAKNILVRYNVSQNDAMEAARQGGHRLFYLDQGHGSLSNQVYNNTFYSGDLDTIFYQGHNVMFVNNIVNSTGAIHQFSTKPLNSSSIIENNILYDSSRSGESPLRNVGQHNIFFDPRFRRSSPEAVRISIGSNGFLKAPAGYEPSSESPALHAGKIIEQNGEFDFLGRAVPSSIAPSIGAYEGCCSR